MSNGYRYKSSNQKCQLGTRMMFRLTDGTIGSIDREFTVNVPGKSRFQLENFIPVDVHVRRDLSGTNFVVFIDKYGVEDIWSPEGQWLNKVRGTDYLTYTDAHGRDLIKLGLTGILTAPWSGLPCTKTYIVDDQTGTPKKTVSTSSFKIRILDGPMC
jgi:hypothetical protein